MGKEKIVFFCKECGYESLKWLGKCPGCSQWNTFVEEKIKEKTSGAKVVSNIPKSELKKLKDNAILPTRGSASAAGYDLYSAEGVFIPAGKTVMVGTGLAMEIPDGFWGGVYARSGLATKQGLRPANCVGVIDSDYRGEIMVALHNDSDSERTIQAGDRIAQLVFHQAIMSTEVDGQAWEVVDSLDNTDRGDGGFGSTGSN